MLFYFTNLCFHMFWSHYPSCCHWCLSQGFYCCYKFRNKNQLGEERVHSSSQPSGQIPSVRRARNLEEWAEAEPGRNAAHWIGPPAWFLTQLRTICRVLALPTEGWAVPQHQLLTKKMPHRLAHRPIWLGPFLS